MELGPCSTSTPPKSYLKKKERELHVCNESIERLRSGVASISSSESRGVLKISNPLVPV